MILLALVPGLRGVAIQTTGNALLAGGVGLVTLVSVPIIAVIVAITIIGLPVAVVGFLLWLVGLYFAKIVIAHIIGGRVLKAPRSDRHFAVALAVGLAVVIVLINLPFIGHILNFLMTLCGLGLLMIFLWDAFRGGPSGEAITGPSEYA